MRSPHQAIDATETPRVLLVDNQPLFCEGMLALFRGLTPAIQAVGVTGLGEAVRQAARFRPHVILLDPTLRDTDPVQAAREIQKARPQAGLLFLDYPVRERHVHWAIQAKAQGYWSKSAAFADLAVAVHRVAAGQPAFCPEAMQYLAKEKGRWRYRPSPASPPFHKLTAREMQVLRYVAQGHSVRECAEALGVAKSTIDNTKTRFMRKLDVHKTTNLTQLAFRHGLIH